jgi:hypothetical protein
VLASRQIEDAILDAIRRVTTPIAGIMTNLWK